MKKIFKALLFSIVLMMIGLIFPTEVSAKVITQDNLKVKFEVESVSGTSDQFIGKVKTTNIGIRDMSNIDIHLKIPKGIKVINEKDIINKISQLKSGESTVLDIQYKLDKEVKPDNQENGQTEEDNNNPPSDGDKDDSSEQGNNDKPSDGDNQSDNKDESINGNKPSNNNSNSGSGNINKPSIDNSGNSTGKPITSDKNNLIVLFVIAIICILLMIILKNNKKDRKKILSIFMIITFVLPLFGNMKIVQAVEESKKTLNLKESIEINKEVYDFEVIVNYTVAKETVIPSGSDITRGEWISKLVNTLGIKEYQEINRQAVDEIEIESDLNVESFKDPFIDIKGNKYEEDIMYGFVNSFLDITEGKFRPDDVATREFATLTAVKALSFQVNENSLTYDDINEVTHKKEIALAISLGLINLENNKFNPNRTLTNSEAEYILQGVKGVLKSEEIDKNYDNEIKFKDEVIKIGQEVKFEINGAQIIFEYDKSLKDIKVGNIVLLPTEIPYKITSISKEGNKLIVDTEEPKIEETLDYVDMQGEGKVDSSKFIPAEGVEIIPAPQVLEEDGQEQIDSNALLNLKFKNDQYNLKGSAYIAIPKVLYKVDMDLGLFKINFNNVFVKLDFKANVNAEMSIEKEGSTSSDKLIELGRIPVIGAFGSTVYIELKLHFNAEGKASLEYDFKSQLGIQVYNNNVRYSQVVNSKADANVEASGKAGISLGVLLEILRIWDLLDFSSELGVQGKAAVIPRIGVVCIDMTGFVYLNISALEDSFIARVLKIPTTWNIINEDNSPIKFYFHSENLKRVPICTYGDGAFIGTVVESTDKTKFVQDAIVEFYNKDNIKINETVTDENGQYTMDLKPGKYTIKISKPGYITFTIKEKRSIQDRVIETAYLVKEDSTGKGGKIRGGINNALNGDSVGDAIINIRSGWNNVSDEIIKTIKTDGYGGYEVQLPFGNYTIEIIKEGFITNHKNIYVTSKYIYDHSAAIVPSASQAETGDLRMVLTWGRNPNLEAHLLGPTKDNNGKFHINYNKREYSEDGVTYVKQDKTNTTAYGPATITIYKMNDEGRYSFYVHDFSNKSNPDSKEMSNSGAKVEVYKGEELYASYDIPANTEGNYWHVFEYDAKNKGIIPVNTILKK